MPRRVLATAGLGFAALVLAACGGTSDNAAQPTRTVPRGSTPPSTPATPTTAPQTCTPTTPVTPPEGKPTITVPSAPAPTTLKTTDIKVGDGPEAKAGDTVYVQYAGVLYKDGSEFDSSWGRGAQPFDFTLGQGMVIPGWDQGVAGMKVGGRRELVIPPDLAYGAQGSPPKIGPNETLVFVVDLEQVCTSAAPGAAGAPGASGAGSASASTVVTTPVTSVVAPPSTVASTPSGSTP